MSEENSEVEAEKGFLPISPLETLGRIAHRLFCPTSREPTSLASAKGQEDVMVSSSGLGSHELPGQGLRNVCSP